MCIAMEKKSDSDGGEPGHSLWSQDTEAISLLSEENNLSLEISSSVLPLDPDDSENIGQTVPSTTACSTPHESKLASTSKRRFESSSEDLSPKKRKLDISGRMSPFQLPLAVLSSSNGTELSNGSEEIPCSKMHISSTYVQKPTITYAEANSSSSPSNHETKECSDSHATSFSKAISPPLKCLEQKRPTRKRDEQKTGEKETKLRHCTEEFIFTVSYTVDEIKKEIISLHVKEVSKHVCENRNALTKLSLSSGTLADTSGSDVNSVYSNAEKFTIPPKLSITSTSSLSSVSSSSSSIPNAQNQFHHSLHKFAMPHLSELKKTMDYRCKGSVCQCFCAKFTNCLLKSPASSRCLTPEMLSSSSDNIKSDSQDVQTQKNELVKKPLSQDETKVQTIIAGIPNEDNIIHGYSSRSSFYVPTCNNLPVFAKWPYNSWFYPGIVENADEETWHTNTNLIVKFCDGTVKKTNTKQLFPAYLLPSKTEVTCEMEGSVTNYIISSVNKLPNNEMLFASESGESIPFEKICFSATHYKELLKENILVLTPRKTPKFSVSIVNVQQGKRTRRVVKTDSSDYVKIGSSSKKTPSSKSKIKRVRSTTDGSSSDQVKTEKKKLRGSNQKKIKEINTPHQSGEFEKKEVVRKLCLETPGCSYKHSIESKKAEESESLSSTDPESSGYKNIVLDDISSQFLDVEEVPNISRRHLRNKSSLKKNVQFHGKVQENVDKLGPLPEIKLFSNYNFVLTHSKKKVKPALKSSDERSYSEEGTDFEDYYETTVPFDYIWLREQLVSGGGKVYRSLLDIPQEEFFRTIVITDNIFETPNYLLAVSFGIPIYRHDLIVNCCVQKKSLTQMLSNAMRMPHGRSLESGQWIEKSNKQPLKGYCCFLLLDVNNSTLNFWKKLILNSGATVIAGDPIELITERRNHISFIVGDSTLPEDVYSLADGFKIPVVSTIWVIQTIINGKPRSYDSRPEYSIYYMTTEDNE